MAMTCSAPSPPDMLIDNLMIYWATETIGSSMRVYYDHRHFRAPFKATDHVRVPTRNLHVAQGSGDYSRGVGGAVLQRSSAFLAEARGHFPAWEAPEDPNI